MYWYFTLIIIKIKLLSFYALFFDTLSHCFLNLILFSLDRSTSSTSYTVRERIYWRERTRASEPEESIHIKVCMPACLLYSRRVGKLSATISDRCHINKIIKLLGQSTRCEVIASTRGTPRRSGSLRAHARRWPNSRLLQRFFK